MLAPFAAAQEEGDLVDEEVIAEYEAQLEEIAAEAEFVLPVDPETAKVQAHLAVRRGLITRVCDLTPGQQKKLAGMDNQWLGELSKNNEVNQNVRGVQPGLIGMFFGVQPQAPRAVRKQNLQKKVDEELANVLTDQQKKTLESEEKKSKEFRDSAVADALIESLQDRLDMTEKQRTEIKEKILPWVARSDLVVIHYFNGNNYYPDIPIHLLGALSDEQRKAYLSLQRHTWTHDNFNDGNVPIVIEE
ncbi:MAG: hypothetical protein WBD20_03835 [Pirellulaceae bacterium]